MNTCGPSFCGVSCRVNTSLTLVDGVLFPLTQVQKIQASASSAAVSAGSSAAFKAETQAAGGGATVSHHCSYLLFLLIN